MSVFLGCTTVSTAPVEAQEAKLQQVGAWTVIVVRNQGRFDRCIGETRSASGVLRVAFNANNVWAISFPGGALKGSQLGLARLNRLEAPNVLFTDHGARASAPLSPRWVDEFRRGGPLLIRVANKSFAWDMRDNGPMMAVVESCTKQNRGTNVAVAPMRPQGFAHVRPHGYAPPPPPVYVVMPQQPAPRAADPVQQVAATSAPMADPIATLKYVYANIDKPRDEPFSRRLMTLRDAAIKRSDEIKEPVSGLDFDYAINGQDAEPDTARSVRYQILGQDARKASIKVSLKNGNPIELRYDLVLEEGKWKIDEVWQIGGDAWALTDLLRQGAAAQ